MTTKEQGLKASKQIKIEWCENWIKALFARLARYDANGIYTEHFWDLAVKAGLYERDTYGTPMTQALSNLCCVMDVVDDRGCTLYSVFKPKGTKPGEHERLLG